MAKIKSYMNPNIPKPKPRTSGDGESRRITKPMEPIKRRRITPMEPGERRRITPPKGEKRPIRKPIKPINKPGVNPTKKKTGPRRSNRNDMIRSMIKPDGTRVLRTSGITLPSKSKSRGSR